ncbi:hypothetical protein T11_3192 [Trichinella zimbabwensis]|uniref:Uncharacterized protein n=1 Tax=Trichinella zimbabwensis TaxID=268475 RepID=A0A0V1HEK7_9BILA|nr:hypothetical protein T11_3192 [Trichinella zimbabwensis]
MPTNCEQKKENNQPKNRRAMLHVMVLVVDLKCAACREVLVEENERKYPSIWCVIHNLVNKKVAG